MTVLKLVLRNLRYFRGVNLAVIAGMAVATAVLTGALLVGDSVRGSLRDLAIQRLGPVDHALIAPRFFDASLADRLNSKDAESQVVPAIVIRGGASDESGQYRTGGVNIAAVGGDWLPVEPGEGVINQMLGDTLHVGGPGASVRINVPTPGDVPRDATLARRSLDEVTSRPQVRVARIASEPGFASMFSLEGSQRLPRNVWMNLADLQREIRQPRRANILLAKGGRIDALNARLRDVIQLDDYGLRFAPNGSGDEYVLSSRSTYIPPAVDEAAERAAKGALRRVSVQLINNVVKLDATGAEQSQIHYAVAAGISSLADESLAEDEIALNEWAATRLKATVGDRIRLDYYQRRADGELEEVRSDRAGVGLTFRVKRILPMSGLGVDRTLTPDYPGLTDKASIREAPPELGIRDELLGDDDEAYWKQYCAAPKVFLNFETGKGLWGDTHGALTGIRIPAAQAKTFERDLLREIDPAAMGMTFRPIKAQQITAASGSTDFSMLFVGLSFFLIVSAALLVAMFFRLSVEQRARQFGVLSAMGFTPRALYRTALMEGLILACVGGVIGLACAVGYTWLIVTGLRTWWVDAVGTSALQTHVAPMTLLIGFVATLFIAMLAIAWAARQLRKTEAIQLLSGGWSANTMTRSRPRISPFVSIISALAGSALVIAGTMNLVSQQVAFFGGGALLLIASLCGVGWYLKSGAKKVAPIALSIRSLALRTTARHPARSLLTVCLIALASFLLVTVAAMRQSPPADPGAKDSGTGGYRLIVQADIPLLADLNSPAGREWLGMRDARAAIWNGARFMPLRRWSGQDASCLNLTRPTSPTILAVPHTMVEQNRFGFAETIQKRENPWTLLEDAPVASEEIPVIADHETAQYILKLGIGDALSISDPQGAQRRLRLVATLKGSIFQSELLMGEGNFRRLFPFQSGAGVVLVETDAQHAPELRRAIADELEPFAVTVDSTADRLAAYKQVANTYLATFQTLGFLGLLLGTVGLAVVLLRELIERRSEMALLAAIGFSPRRRLQLILTQNVTLLLLGLLAGSLCALVGVMPAVMSAGAIYVSGLLAALGAVLFTGLLVLALAAWFGGRRQTPADLRRE